MRDYPTRGGKALRPSICLATCEAFGGSLDDALPSAVAIELLHNAFLVHDDIEDASLLRRGEPTLHLRYGTPLALNAGDGLALQAMATLRENIDLLGPRLADRIMVEFDFMSQQTVAGQALELGWCRDNRIDSDAGRLPRAHHEEDVLVHDGAAPPGRCPRRVAGERPRSIR